MRLAADRLREIYLRPESPSRRIRLNALAHSLLQEGEAEAKSRLERCRHPVVEAAENALKQGRHRWQIDDLARETGLSSSHFRSIFRRETGLSAGQWLTRMRMIEARRLLRESPWPVKQIASTIGYSDVVAFHRAFKRSTGETPAAYRNKSFPAR